MAEDIEVIEDISPGQAGDDDGRTVAPMANDDADEETAVPGDTEAIVCAGETVDEVRTAMGSTTTSLPLNSGPTRLALVQTGSPFGPSAYPHAEGYPPIQRIAVFFHRGGKCPVCASVRAMNITQADRTARKYSHAAFCRNAKCFALKGPG